eukprot:gene5486-5364_t
MHWWTSASERSAANALAQAFNSHGLQWQDAAVEGGGGGAAVKVLKSRVLSGSPPAAAQIIGTMLTDWADMGLVLPLTRVAAQEAWKQQIFPEVLHLVTHKHQPIAVPLGIHRINSVLYQRTIFDKLEMPPPRDWAALEGVARRLRNAGITPIAWSDENWQVATVFEAVLLSYAGPELYERLVRARHPEAWLDRRVESALNRLRWLRDLNGPMQRQESNWIDNVKAFHAGRFGILMNGDWVRGELLALTGSSDSSSYCAPMPGTEGMHLYSIDTLSMLKGSMSKQSEQEKAAALLTSVTLQRSYNRVKGSVPVLKDIDPNNPEGCDVPLTGMDFNLLKIFLDNPGEVMDRSRLMEATRGRDLGPLDRSLDVQISRLRQRLQDDGKQAAMIKTVRGSGYAFTAQRPDKAPGWRAWLPDTLLGRMTWLMVIGVLSTQGLGNWLWTHQISAGVRQDSLLAAAHMATSASATVRYFRDLPSAYRVILIEQLRSMGGTRFFVNLSISPGGTLVTDLPSAWHMAQVTSRFASAIHVEPVPETGSAEMRRTARAINEMQASIQKYVEDRTRLFAGISHDLKTPITRLKLRTELLDDDELRNDFHEDLDELDEMVINALQAVRDSQIHENLSDLPLDRLIERLIAPVNERVEWAGESLTVKAKPLALRRALGNLIDNALRYGDRLSIQVQRQDDWAAILLLDNGPGIPVDDLDKLGQPYEVLK